MLDFSEIAQACSQESNSDTFPTSLLDGLVSASISDSGVTSDYSLLPATVSLGKAFDPNY